MADKVEYQKRYYQEHKAELNARRLANYHKKKEEDESKRTSVVISPALGLVVILRRPITSSKDAVDLPPCMKYLCY